MASSPSGKQRLEAKKCLLDLQGEIEEFGGRLRQESEQTNQSIHQLSIDFQSNCLNVWQEFDSLVETARLKAAKLCDEMRLKTQDQQREWRRTLSKKEYLLEEAAKWLNDLRQLLGAGDDDDDDVRRLQTEGSELISRLRESSSPVGKGQFVVTFPDWCRRAISDLQDEVVDFASRTWPPMNLELPTECCLQDSNLQIYSFAVSDEDGHVFVVDGRIGYSIKEFSESGEFIDQYPFGEEGETFCPWEICRLPEDRFVVCGWSGSGSGYRRRILFLTRQKSQPFLKKEKIIDTKGKTFSSLCQMKEEIFVSVLDCEEILCYSKESRKLKTIKTGGWPESGGSIYPLLRANPTTGNLWLTGIKKSEYLIMDKKGQILQKLETETEILDFCSDKFGHFYFCNNKGIYSVLPEKILYEFPEECKGYYPRIFVSQEKLFLSFQNDGKYSIKIFQIN